MKHQSNICKSGLTVALLFTACVHANAKPTLTGITFDEANKEIHLEGSSFGPGPHVVLFDNFEEGNKFSNLLRNISSDWFKDVVIHKEASGNHAHRARDPLKVLLGQKGATQMVVNFGKDYTEAFIAFSVKVPEGTTFPGASSPRTFADVSSWKLTWLMSGANGFQEKDKFDVCLPSHPGKGQFYLGGNTGTLTWLDHGNTWWAWDDYNHMTSHIQIDPDRPDEKPINYSWAVTNSKTTLEETGTTPASKFAGTNYSFDRINIPGWWGNGDNSKFDGLYDNLYVAVGENSLARAVITDNEKYMQSTVAITIMGKSWSNGEITFDMDSIPQDKAYFVHIFDRNGERSPTALKICPRCPKMDIF